MNILVTSASSLLGHYLCRYFLKKNFSVTGTYRRFNTRIKDLTSFSGFNPLQLEFTFDSSSPVLGSFDCIINSTGAYPSEGVSSSDIVFANIKVAESIFNNLIDFSPPSLLINFSSLSVHGNLSFSDYIDESTVPSPTDTYGTTKLLSEQILSSCNSIERIAHLRFPVVLGKGAHRAWLPTMLHKMRNNLPITLTNPHKLYGCCTTMMAVANFCEKLIVQKFRSPVEIFPLASIPDLSIMDIFSILSDRLNYALPPQIISNSSPSVFIDTSHARSYGYDTPMTSSAINYWLSRELT